MLPAHCTTQDRQLETGTPDFIESVSAEIAAAVPAGATVARSQAAFLRAVDEHTDTALLRVDALEHVRAVAWVVASTAAWSMLTARPTWPGRLEYGEGLDIGYRAPAYPFGFGLGYTTWAIDDLVVAARVAPGDDVTASVTVANTGARSGRHVVQLYLTRTDSDIDRPALWLAGFGAASVEPGNTAAVTVTVSARAFAHWDPDRHAWETEPGAFTLRAGSSVDDLPVAATVVVG